MSKKHPIISITGSSGAGTTSVKRTFEQIKPGSEGHALWPEMETDPADLFVAKNRYSAFLPSASELTKALRGRNIDSVIIVGTLTNVCCESSARDAAMQDFKTFLAYFLLVLVRTQLLVRVIKNSYDMGITLATMKDFS